MNPSITVYQFNTELSRCCQFCGLDTGRYKGHSFRTGAASVAADNGTLRNFAETTTTKSIQEARSQIRQLARMHVCLLNLITTLATIENGDSDKKWDLESDSFTVFIGLSALPVGKHPHLPLSPPP